jgi:hypothetical protein
LDTLLWVVQWVLAVLFLLVGGMRLVMPSERLLADERSAWVRDTGIGVARLSGATEVAGAVALVLPGLVDTAVVLTPLAGLGLGLQQVIAAFWVHRPRKETGSMAVNAVLAVLCVFVGVGRFVLPL